MQLTKSDFTPETKARGEEVTRSEERERRQSEKVKSEQRGASSAQHTSAKKG